MTAAAGVARDPNHEDVFIARYDQLLKWASLLTRHDRELAKDLVHDAFLQFTLSDGDLVNINNIDNYLYGVVRNAYLSHLRRTSRQAHQSLPSLETESATSGFPTFDPRRQIRVKDELRAVCHYACVRKDSSNTASILILRFFHGYVPSEIAKLINTSRNIVDVQLRLARSEALAHLENRNSSLNPNKTTRLHRLMKVRMQLATDLFTELRQAIFRSRRGDCFEEQRLTNVYRTHKTLPRPMLSHLVSCPDCLDAANRLLDLPLLRDRNALDVIGRANETEMRVVYTLTMRICAFVGGPLLSLVSSSVYDFLC